MNIMDEDVKTYYMLPDGVNAILEKTDEFFISYQMFKMKFLPGLVEAVCDGGNDIHGSDMSFEFLGYITYREGSEIVREQIAVWKMVGSDYYSFWGKTTFPIFALIKMIESV